MKKEHLDFYLRIGAKNLGISEKFVDFLEKGDFYLKFFIPFEKRKGELSKIKFEAFLSSKIKGAYFGEINFKEDFEEIEDIAFLNTFSNSLFDFPFGGMCLNIGISEDEYSLWERRLILRNFLENILKIDSFKNSVYIPGKGISNDSIMILYDEIMAKGLNPTLHILGKTPEIYGFSEIEKIFCELLIFSIETMLEDYGENITNKRITFYGFDKYSDLLIEKFYEKKAKSFIINVEDERFFKVKDEIRSKFRTLLEDEMFAYETDIFIISETGNEISKDRASFLNSKYVIEMKPFSIRPEAEEIISRRGIALLPDIFIKGILNSIYFEEYIKREKEYKEEEIITKLKKKFVGVYRDTLGIGIAKNLSIKKSSYMIALGRIMKLIGTKGV